MPYCWISLGVARPFTNPFRGKGSGDKCRGGQPRYMDFTRSTPTFYVLFMLTALEMNKCLYSYCLLWLLQKHHFISLRFEANETISFQFLLTRQGCMTQTFLLSRLVKPAVNVCCCCCYLFVFSRIRL